MKIRIAVAFVVVAVTGLIYRGRGENGGQALVWKPAYLVESGEGASPTRSLVLLKTDPKRSTLERIINESVVCVTARVGDQKRIAAGFVIEVDRRREVAQIATAQHVVIESEQITIVFANEETKPGKLIATDAKNDLALIEVSAGKLKALTIAPTFGPYDNFKVIGAGRGIFPFVLPRGASGLIKTDDGPDDHLFFFGCCIEGMSGGPVLNEREQVVAMTQKSMMDKVNPWSFNGLACRLFSQEMLKSLQERRN